MNKFYTNYSVRGFMHKATACAGNWYKLLLDGDWTAVLISGIKVCSPRLYEAMPDVSYDYDTVAHVCNVICAEHDLDYADMLSDFKDMDVDHDYWLECVRKAHNVCIEVRDCQLLAYLWMFKQICFDKELPIAQVRKTCEYLHDFERYIKRKGGYLK